MNTLELVYDERYYKGKNPDEISELALKFGLSNRQIGAHWQTSEAGVFIRYLDDLNLQVSDFKNKNCIDIGCGFGLFKDAISKLTSPKHFVNLDCDIKPAARVDILADARKLPFKDQSFDIVLAYGSIFGVLWDDFLTRKKLNVIGPESLEEIIRILKPDGIAKIGPISLLRSCWRSSADIDLYLHSARPQILSILEGLKNTYPQLKMKITRIIGEEENKRFDEWIELHDV